MEGARGPSWQRRPTDVCEFQGSRFKGSCTSPCGEGRAGGRTLPRRLPWPGVSLRGGAVRICLPMVTSPESGVHRKCGFPLGTLDLL